MILSYLVRELIPCIRCSCHLGCIGSFQDGPFCLVPTDHVPTNFLSSLSWREHFARKRNDNINDVANVVWRFRKGVATRHRQPKTRTALVIVDHKEPYPLRSCWVVWKRFSWIKFVQCVPDGNHGVQFRLSCPRRQANYHWYPRINIPINNSRGGNGCRPSNLSILCVI